MKKILLSVIALFAAISVNAKLDIDISSIGALNTPIAFSGSWDWKGQMVSTGEVTKDEAAGTADDAGVTYFDGSAYDYLIVKYTSDSEKIKGIIQYNITGEIGQWGPNYHESSATLKAATDAYFALKLSDHKNTISQVAFQDQGAAVNLTISEIFWATEAEYNEIVLGLEPGEEPSEQPTAETVDILPKFTNTWNNAESIVDNADGSKTFNAVQWGGMAAWLANDDVKADWSGYSSVVFEFAEATTVNTQILVGDAKAWGEVGITKLECSFEDIDMSAIDQIALQASDATTITITKAYLVVKAGSATNIQNVQVAKAADDAIYNIAGQKVNASYKGLVIKNGKKYFQK